MNFVCYCAVGRNGLVSPCSHNRSVKYFNESINNGTFTATQCESWAEFRSAFCNSAPQSVMGFHLRPSDVEAISTFYLRTSSSSPFALGEIGAANWEPPNAICNTILSDKQKKRLVIVHHLFSMELVNSVVWMEEGKNVRLIQWLAVDMAQVVLLLMAVAFFTGIAQGFLFTFSKLKIDKTIKRFRNN